jgi:inorganic pyrophosphatase
VAPVPAGVACFSGRSGYQPTRLRSSTALRCSLRRSSAPWIQEATITKTVKKITTPSEKNVMILSSVSPQRPSPLSPATAVAAGISQAASTRIGVSFRTEGNDSLSRGVAESFFCIVEIPKGSRNKYEFDHEHNVIRLDRFLFSSVVYPTDYGFIPETLSLDGDPLDVMVLVSEPTFPGCMIEVKPIGLFRMEDDQGIDDKVLCVPLTDPGWNTVESLDAVGEQLQNEIAHFFTVYKQLENKKVEVDGWYSCEDALKVIDESRTRYSESSDDHSGEPPAAPH